MSSENGKKAKCNETRQITELTGTACARGTDWRSRIKSCCWSGRGSSDSSADKSKEGDSETHIEFQAVVRLIKKLSFAWLLKWC